MLIRFHTPYLPGSKEDLGGSYLHVCFPFKYHLYSITLFADVHLDMGEKADLQRNSADLPTVLSLPPTHPQSIPLELCSSQGPYS